MAVFQIFFPWSKKKKKKVVSSAGNVPLASGEQGARTFQQVIEHLINNLLGKV